MLWTFSILMYWSDLENCSSWNQTILLGFFYLNRIALVTALLTNCCCNMWLFLSPKFLSKIGDSGMHEMRLSQILLIVDLTKVLLNWNHYIQWGEQNEEKKRHRCENWPNKDTHNLVFTLFIYFYNFIKTNYILFSIKWINLIFFF